MGKDEEPIIKFDALKAKLIALGVDVRVSNKGAYVKIKSSDVTLDDIKNGTLKIESDGIYNIDPNTGAQRRVFLYKRKYNIERFGKPRYHICKCKTIIDFMNDAGEIPEYRQSNTMPVWVIDTSANGKDKEIEKLPLCKNCAEFIGNIDKNTTSDEFVEIIKKAAHAPSAPRNENVEVDVNGYTRDWNIISQRFREKHNFTCERCGVKVMNPFESEFIQTHHKNGNKADNREANLECLCIKCHSEVDETHRRNFSTLANQALIKEFLYNYGVERFKGRDKSMFSFEY